VISEDNDPDIALSLFEQALDASSPIIIIEPQQLGEETSRWIRVGNCLHKTSVLSAVGSIAVSALRISSSIATAAYLSLGVSSVLCASVYAASWQFDPCCKYQTVSESDTLRRLPLIDLVSTSPVVLVRRDDTRRKWLQNVLATAAAIMCMWRIYYARK